VREVGERIFQLEATRGSVNIFLVQADVPVLVDSGKPAQGAAVVEELRAAGVTPKIVLLTHSDFDHAGGAERVRDELGAEVYAPAGERALLDGDEYRRLFVRMLIRAANRGRAPRSPSVDRWIEGGETVAGLEAIATPGHTPGHTSYLLGTTLIAGDAVITGEVFRPPIPMFCVDNAETRRSIEKLAALDVGLAVSGHGPPASGAKRKLVELVATWAR
jgi:glyoxylase-like metal-dependent hydrolase (beta-lactamase superfamily II)